MLEVLRLLLAAVLAVAGAAKLVDRDGSRRAVTGFGVPSQLVAAVAVAVPAAELALAVGLVPATSARAAAAAAAALLVAFAVAIGIALARGGRPDCHCFGRLHSAPAGPATLGRNAGLAAAALLVATQPAAPVGLWHAVVAGGAALVAGQALLSWSLLRRYGTALRRIDELEWGAATQPSPAVGTEAPPFSLRDGDGVETSLESLRARGRAVLLVFADPGCGPCRLLLPQVALWQSGERERLTVAVVTRGGPETDALALEHGLERVLVDADGSVAAGFGVTATPSAVLLDVDGRVALPPAVGPDAVEALVAVATRDAEPPREDPTPVPAPAVLAGGVALAAVGAAQAGAAATADAPSDPELTQIDALFREAAPRLARAAQRASAAVSAQAALRPGTKLHRKRRAAAVRAVAAERKEILALRARIASLEPTSATAHNARAMALEGLAGLARAAQARERALVARPQAARRLALQSQQLLTRSLVPLANAGTLLGRGS